MAKKTPTRNEKKERWREKKRLDKKAQSREPTAGDQLGAEFMRAAESMGSPAERLELERRAELHLAELREQTIRIRELNERIKSAKTPEEAAAFGTIPTKPEWDPFEVAEEVRRDFRTPIGKLMHAPGSEHPTLRALIDSVHGSAVDEVAKRLEEVKDKEDFTLADFAELVDRTKKRHSFLEDTKERLKDFEPEERKQIIADVKDKLYQQMQRGGVIEADTPEDLQRLVEAMPAHEGFSDRELEVMRAMLPGLSKEILRSGPPYRFDAKAVAARIRAAARTQQPLKQQPQRRGYKPQKHHKAEDMSVEMYLALTASVLRIARESTIPDQRAASHYCYERFKNARVFHIDQEVRHVVAEEAERFLHALIENAPDGETEWLMDRAARDQPWPEVFPFPSVFLGYGFGVRLPDREIQKQAPEILAPHITKLWLAGHLVTAEGDCFQCFNSEYLDRDGSTQEAHWVAQATRSPEGWVRGAGHDPWVVPHVIRIINEYRTFVVSQEVSRAIQRSIKENRKPLGIEDYKRVPKPFYTLKLQTQVVQEHVRKTLGKPRSPASYRTDVRAHERCRIRRGKLPIDPKLAAKLEKRGYKLFTTNELDQETYQRLMERGLAYKRADEWLAVKASWVKDHMSSTDESLPYVPAVRRMGEAKRKRATGAWTDDPAS